jgi:hypothetical protein
MQASVDEKFKAPQSAPWLLNRLHPRQSHDVGMTRPGLKILFDRTDKLAYLVKHGTTV